MGTDKCHMWLLRTRVLTAEGLEHDHRKPRVNDRLFTCDRILQLFINTRSEKE